MKQIYSIFISAALLLNVGLTSCDSFLTETPQGELTEANAFTSIKDGAIMSTLENERLEFIYEYTVGKEKQCGSGYDVL